MSASGAKVLQLRSVEYARNHGVRIHCRSSFEDGPGTLVVAEEETMEQPFVTAVTHSDAEARVTLTGVRDEPGVAGRIFTALAEANVNVDVIIQNEPVGDDELADLSFTVDRSDLTTATDTVAGLGGSATGSAPTSGSARSRSSAPACARTRRRRQGLRGARRRGDQHRDDLHLADQDLLRDLRRPRPRRGAGRCTRRSTSAPTRSAPRTRPARAPPDRRRLSARHTRDGGDGYRVGVLGATGAGRLDDPRACSPSAAFRPPRWCPSPPSARPAGSSSGTARCWSAGALSEETIQGLDIVLSSAGGAVSAEWAPRFVEAGAVVVDNTSYWRMHDDVPLVVAGVNPEAADAHRGIVANPNCTTMVMMVALAPIHRAAGLERLVVSTYQAVSGTGQRAIEELRAQSTAVLDGGEAPAAEVYPHRIAFNVLPQVEVFKDGDDYTDRGAQGDGGDAQDPRPRRGGRDLRHLRPRPGRHRPLGVGQRPDPRGPLPERVPRAARRGAGRGRRRRPGRRRATRWRSTPPGATRSWSAASAATPATSAASTSGWSATTCARARRPTPSRSPSCWSSAACSAKRELAADGHRLRRRAAALRRAAGGRRGALGGDAGHGALRLGPLGRARHRPRRDRGGQRRRRATSRSSS